MFKEITIKTWGEFNDTIKDIKNKYGFTAVGDYKNEHRVFYRGLPNEKYNLSSTLERYEQPPSLSIIEYARILQKCSSEIESYTGFNWNLPDYKKWEVEYKQNYEQDPKKIIKIPFLEFWIHVRHCGFPSPLLDWSASPYIAAFFAFEEQNMAEYVAIYVYVEPIEVTCASSTSITCIRVIGEPGTRTNKRHYLQQTWYTLAYITNELKNEHLISGYEDFVNKNKDKKEIFLKIKIPRSERISALKYLSEHNINRFSLMNSESSLLSTLAFKEFEMGKNFTR